MLAGQKTADTRNNSLSIDLSKKEKTWTTIKRLLGGYNRDTETGHLLD